VLPPYGFYAHVPGAENGVAAAIERKGGVVVEWSAGPGGEYVNERGRGVAYRLTRDGQATVLTPLPESEAGLIRIPKRLAMPAAVGPAQALDINGHVLKTVPSPWRVASRRCITSACFRLQVGISSGQVEPDRRARDYLSNTESPLVAPLERERGVVVHLQRQPDVARVHEVFFQTSGPP